MKYSILVLAFISVLSANETHRVKSMVDDIAQLRENYAKCKAELALKQSNSGDSNTTLAELEKKLEIQNKMIETKDKTIYSLKKDFDEKLKIKDEKILSLEKSIKASKDENKFPKLMMKENNTTTAKESVQIEKSVVSEKITQKPAIEESYMVAAVTLTLKVDASIFDAINGKKVAEWKKGTPFTSNQRSKNWIKATGCFAGKNWKQCENEFWIEQEKVLSK